MTRRTQYNTAVGNAKKVVAWAWFDSWYPETRASVLSMQAIRVAEAKILRAKGGSILLGRCLPQLMELKATGQAPEQWLVYISF